MVRPTSALLGTTRCGDKASNTISDTNTIRRVKIRVSATNTIRQLELMTPQCGSQCRVLAPAVGAIVRMAKQINIRTLVVCEIHCPLV